jgi:hypothetical protein
MADFTYSKQISESEGIPFVYFPNEYRMNAFNAQKFMDNEYFVLTIDPDPHKFVRYICSNTPFFVERTIDSEHYLGPKYPLFTDVKFSPMQYKEMVMAAYDYLVNMDKSKFHRNNQSRERYRICLQRQRST